MPVPAKQNSTVKGLNAYYTPATIADMLAQWTVRTGSERILEPSAGAGALIDAAFRHARRLQEHPDIHFVACDINPEAIETIRPRLTDRSEVRAIDFLQLDPVSTGLFDAVLANPPFTRNHDIDSQRRTYLRNRFDTVGAAGLWVHFLFHSMAFLRTGGRLAAVVPASALFSDYGRDCLERVSNRFAEVELRQIVDRPLWTNRADERGALLFAEGFNLGSSLLPAPRRWSASGVPAADLPMSSDAYEELAGQATSLGRIASLSIGAVTGCNSVFLLDEAQRKAQAIGRRDLQPIVSRARQVPGLTIDKAKLLSLACQGEKTWLLAPKQLGEKGGGVRRQLAKISAQRRASTMWFKKRDPWWKVECGAPCDAIFTYMNDRGPRMVLATEDVSCTNTLHCVRFEEHVDENQRLAACLTLLSTFGQLAAERLGRIYGGGLLKFELKDARKFPILLPKQDLASSFAKADAYLADGHVDEATRVADEALLAPLLGKRLLQAIGMLREEIDARQKVRRDHR